MGSFEYYQTSFSYQDRELGEEKFVGVPEQGGRDLSRLTHLPLAASYGRYRRRMGLLGFIVGNHSDVRNRQA